MKLFSKIYRNLAAALSTFCSHCRIWHYRLKYPALTIDNKSTIAAGCKMVFVDSAKVTITNSHFGFGCFIVAEAGSTLSISNSSLGPNSALTAMQHIEIKSHCSIAEMVVIRDQNHEYGNGKLICESGYETGKIVIEENVWIGAKATILKNVTIGRNSVIGANALVNKSFAENSLIGGVPARLLVKK